MGLFGRKKDEISEVSYKIDKKAKKFVKISQDYNRNGGHEIIQINYIDEALKISPDYAFAWEIKGNLLNRIEKYEEAISCFDEVIRLEVNSNKYSIDQQNATTYKNSLLDKLAKLKNKKSIERKGWSESEKEEVRINQDGKCALCQKPPPRWEYDHIDGDRSNDSVSNCQGLCPNCHSVKKL